MGDDVATLQDDAITGLYAQRLPHRIDADGFGSYRILEPRWEFLSFVDRDVLLDLNLPLAERATKDFPNDPSERTAQQFWSDTQRQQIVRYTRDQASRAVDDRGSDVLVKRRDHALVGVLAYMSVRGAELVTGTPDF